MKTYTKEELDNILAKHKLWLEDKSGGIRANLSHANLSNADLRGANLISANLIDADLFGANLSNAKLFNVNLSGANLFHANLTDANLVSADLYTANLYRANLYGADLSDANLSNANLSDVDLSGANLSNAYLFNAKLYNAKLSNVNLSGANLISANLYDADLFNIEIDSKTKIPPISIVPETGTFEGWKKLKNGVIIRIQIPAKAGRVNSTGRKCRAEYCKVIEVYSKTKKKLYSMYDPHFEYKKGKIIRPDKWDPDFRKECTHGIHFFLTRKEAEDYE